MEKATAPLPLPPLILTDRPFTPRLTTLPSDYDSDSNPGTPLMTPTTSNFPDQPPSYEEAQRALDPNYIPNPSVLQIHRLVISDEFAPALPPQYTDASNNHANFTPSRSGTNTTATLPMSVNEKNRESHAQDEFTDLANQPATQPIRIRSIEHRAQELGSYLEKLGADFSKRSEAFGDTVSLRARTWANDFEKRTDTWGENFIKRRGDPSSFAGPFIRVDGSGPFCPRIEQHREEMVEDRMRGGFSYPGRCPRGGFGNHGFGHPSRRAYYRDGMSPREQVHACRDEIKQERDLTCAQAKEMKWEAKGKKREMKGEARDIRRELKYEFKAWKREVKEMKREKKREWKTSI